MPGSASDDSAALERAVVAFVRRFGLLEGSSTPCGQPLPPSQAHALTELSERACSQKELASVLCLRKSTVSRLVDQLVDRGWAQRCPDRTDARVVRVVLTPDGRRVAGQVGRARRELMDDLLARVPDHERAPLVRGMRHLVAAMEGRADA